MHPALLDHCTSVCIPLILVAETEFSLWLDRQDEQRRQWLTTTGFSAKPGSYGLIPGADGRLAAVVAGIKSADDLWALGGLPGSLPPGDYMLEATLAPRQQDQLTLGWVLGAYQFKR